MDVFVCLRKMKFFVFSVCWFWDDNFTEDSPQPNPWNLTANNVSPPQCPSDIYCDQSVFSGMWVTFLYKLFFFCEERTIKTFLFDDFVLFSPPAELLDDTFYVTTTDLPEMHNHPSPKKGCVIFSEKRFVKHPSDKTCRSLKTPHPDEQNELPGVPL